MKKEQKLHLHTSGSLDQATDHEAETAPASQPAVSEEDERASELFKQILDAASIDKLLEESFVENNLVVQSQDGNALWLLSLSTKSFKLLPNNSVITMIDRIDDSISHCLINSDLYEVKNELIKDIGWN